MGEIKSETQSLSPSPVSEPLQPPQELQQEIENLEPPLQAPAPISLEAASELTDQTSSGAQDNVDQEVIKAVQAAQGHLVKEARRDVFFKECIVNYLFLFNNG